MILIQEIKGMEINGIQQEMMQKYFKGISQVRYPFYLKAEYNLEMQNVLYKIAKAIFNSSNANAEFYPGQGIASVSDLQTRREAQESMFRLHKDTGLYLEYLASLNF